MNHGNVNTKLSAFVLSALSCWHTDQRSDTALKSRPMAVLENNRPESFQAALCGRDHATPVPDKGTIRAVDHHLNKNQMT